MDEQTAESLALALGTHAADAIPRDAEVIVIVVRGDRVGFSSTLPDASARELLGKLSAPKAG